jgi:hypothetical protein
MEKKASVACTSIGKGKVGKKRRLNHLAPCKELGFFSVNRKH